MNGKQMCVPAFAAGATLTVLGLLGILLPQRMVKVFPVALGLLVLCYGIYELGAGVFRRHKEAPLYMPRCVQGVVSVAVGLVLVLNRQLSVVFLGVVLGLWGLIGGVISLRTAWKYRQSNEPVSYWDGGWKLLVGVLMMLFPLGGMTAWAMVLGWVAFLAGLCMLVSAHCFYKMLRSLAQQCAQDAQENIDALP